MISPVGASMTSDSSSAGALALWTFIALYTALLPPIYCHKDDETQQIITARQNICAKSPGTKWTTIIMHFENILILIIFG